MVPAETCRAVQTHCGLLWCSSWNDPTDHPNPKLEGINGFLVQLTQKVWISHWTKKIYVSLHTLFDTMVALHSVSGPTVGPVTQNSIPSSPYVTAFLPDLASALADPPVVKPKEDERPLSTWFDDIIPEPTSGCLSTTTGITGGSKHSLAWSRLPVYNKTWRGHEKPSRSHEQPNSCPIFVSH